MTNLNGKVRYYTNESKMTYVPLEVAERFEGFIIQRDEQVLDAVRAKTKDFSTLFYEITVSINSNPMTFSDCIQKSKIRMKKSFLNYLHFCRIQIHEKERVGSNVIIPLQTKEENVRIITINEKIRSKYSRRI